MHVLSRSLLQYMCCLQQDWAAVWLDDQLSSPCSTLTWSHPSNAPTLQRSLYASYSCLNGRKNALVRGAGLISELCLGSEQDREVLFHLPVSQPLGMVRDSKIALHLT